MYQYRKLMSTKREQIAERSSKHKDVALHNLHRFIDKELLKACYLRMKKKSASGVDGETWLSYGENLEKNLKDLLERFRRGEYQAPNVRRTYLEKGNGKKRPLGIPTIEDKILQSAVKQVLEPIYEQEFMNCSYGFRPGRSQHQAIQQLFDHISYGQKRYIIDADVQNYFGEINHEKLRGFLDHRVKDGVIRKMIDKWLKAGIQEKSEVWYPEDGTPQGGVISPLLSNICLHYVLDEWFSKEIQPLLKGTSMIVRFADDFVLGFSSLEDAERVLEVLSKRFAKYGLRLHPEKTKLIDLETENRNESRDFDFLGFTHYQGRSKRGYKILKRKTSLKKFTQSIKKMRLWIKENRHRKLRDLIKDLNRKLIGYYNYYGITHNARRLNDYYNEVIRLLKQWLNRRGGKPKPWSYFSDLLTKWLPVRKPKISHSYRKANP